MIKEYKYGFRVKPGRDDLIISWIEGIQASDKSYCVFRWKRTLIPFFTEQRFRS
jgi:hypothetical protein